jgi:hypothetical protein
MPGSLCKDPALSKDSASFVQMKCLYRRLFFNDQREKGRGGGDFSKRLKPDFHCLTRSTASPWEKLPIVRCPGEHLVRTLSPRHVFAAPTDQE